MAEKNRRQTMAKVSHEKDIGESVEVRIASAIKELPSAPLAVLAHPSPKQQEVWQSLRGYNEVISACFLANSFGWDDPISDLTRGSRSERLKHSEIWADVFFLRNLWNLVQQAFVYLKEDVKEAEELRQVKFCFETHCPSSFNFFLETLRLEEDLIFARYCQQFYRFSVPDALAEAKIRKKGIQTEKDAQKLKELQKHAPNNPPFQWLVACSLKHKRQNSTLRVALDALMDSLEYRFTVREQLLEANKRGRLDFKLYSFGMHDGQEVKQRGS